MMMIQIMPIWTEMIMINMEKVPMGPMVPMDHIDVVVVGHRPGGAHLFGWDPVGGSTLPSLDCHAEISDRRGPKLFSGN